MILRTLSVHSSFFTGFTEVQVYEVFSQLALFARSGADSYRSSFANELFMIVRKQVLWLVEFFFLSVLLV